MATVHALTSEITGPAEEIGLYCWEKVERSRPQSRKQLRQPSQCHQVCEVRKTRQLHLPSAPCRRNPLAKHMLSPEGPSLQWR